MKKTTTNTNDIRKKLNALFKPVVRGGEPFVQEFDEDGNPINFNKVVRRKDN